MNLIEPSVELAGSSFVDYERKTEAEKEEELKQEFDPDDSGDLDGVTTALEDETPRQEEGLRRRVTAERSVEV